MASIKTYLAIALTLAPVSLDAGNIAALKDLCPSGGKVIVDRHFVIGGVVVSDCGSKNIENNPNRTHSEVDLSVNDATVYLQEEDGSAGVRLVFNERSDNGLRRYDRVSIDLAGCTVMREASPDRVTVSGLDYLKVISYAPGSPEGVTVKRKFISELTDADLYTMVELRDAEMTFKDGSYADIYEGYAQYVKGFPYEGDYLPNLRMDGWASLMRDSRGGSIYMLVNTGCPWRRDGKGVFQGAGPVRGVIVHTPLRRYGGDMGRYSLRPVTYSDIAGSGKSKSPWKCLTGWKTDGSRGASLVFDGIGEQSGLEKNGRKGVSVCSDSGITEGLLWTDSDSYIHIDDDLNRLDASRKGVLKCGAISFKGPTKGWFVFDAKGRPVGAKSFYISFSTRKVQGDVLQFSFSWLAGDWKAEHDRCYPGEWKVEYALGSAPDRRSSDSGSLEWKPLRDNATSGSVTVLRSHPWWDAYIKGSTSGKKLTGYDCGLGMQQHSYNLPGEVFGKDNVLIRITPAGSALSMIRTNPARDVLDPPGVPSPGMKNVTWIRFGNISADYK